jgi:hypothetical protein
MRIASGAEALVARVLTVDGVAGFGFTLNFEAIVAREMAAWDALAKTRGVPFHGLFGSRTRERVDVVAAGANVIDPFEGATLEEIRQRAWAAQSVAFLAPHAHPWEISYCAAIAATVPGDARVAIRAEPIPRAVPVSDAPGLDIDWSAEPGFGSLRWFAG